MASESWWSILEDRVPGVLRLKHLPRQLIRRSPFDGTIKPARVPLVSFGSGRPTQPFPHPWNYREPLRILDAFFWNADDDTGSGRHNRYLEMPGFMPVLVTRDPRVIRAISTETGAKPGQFDRDTMPSIGIARATGRDTLLYANGESWKHQKKLATPPFARTSLFQPEQFGDFEHSFRLTIRERLNRLREHVKAQGEPVRLELEPEIKAVMLELLVNNFFGASVPYEEVREKFVPALDRVIDHIVSDTVINKLGLPLEWIPGAREAKEARAIFEELTDRVIAVRGQCKGQWGHFRSDAPDEALRSNIRVFLAGALEATTSYAAWAIAHLSRNLPAQEKAYAEIHAIEDYTPDTLAQATYLDHILNETLRLTPALYFHPRRASVDTWITTISDETLFIPKRTHILLDIWHANRHDDFWGEAITGYPAAQFIPERWDNIAKDDRNAHDLMHFGFGHGPRFCPGKSLGQLEVALVVGACIKVLNVQAVNEQGDARAGVSTKPKDGVLVDVRLRPYETPARKLDPTGAVQPSTASRSGEANPAEPGSTGCPFSGR